MRVSRTVSLYLVLPLLLLGVAASAQRVAMDVGDLVAALRAYETVEAGEFSAEELSSALTSLSDQGRQLDHITLIDCRIYGRLALPYLNPLRRRAATDEEVKALGLAEGRSVYELGGLRLFNCECDGLIIGFPPGVGFIAVVIDKVFVVSGSDLGYLIIENCLLKNRAVLSGNRLGSLTIDGCVLLREYDEDSVFDFPVLDLNGTDIDGDLIMRDSTFVGPVDLSRLTGRGPALFRDLEFGGAMTVSNTAFSRYVEFNGCSFNNRLSLENTLFGWGVDFIDIATSEARDSTLAYRIAASSWKYVGDHDRADEYFLRYMVNRRNQLPRLARALEFALVDLPSRYGTNWGRVLISWLVVIGVGSAMFFAGSGIEKKGGGHAIRSLPLSVYFSVVTFTTLGYGDYQPRGAFKILACVMAILGSYMMALFVYVFVSSFMR